MGLHRLRLPNPIQFMLERGSTCCLWRSLVRSRWTSLSGTATAGLTGDLGPFAWEGSTQCGCSLGREPV